MDLLDFSETTPKLAQKRTRVFAVLLDYAIYFVIFIFITIAFGERQTRPDGYAYVVTNGYAQLAIFLFWIILFPVIEGISGQTIGKKVFKIIVVKTDYSNAGIGYCFVRHIFDCIDGFPFGLIGLLVASNTTLKQRVGDLVANTIVVEVPQLSVQ